MPLSTTALQKVKLRGARPEIRKRTVRQKKKWQNTGEVQNCGGGNGDEAALRADFQAGAQRVEVTASDAPANRAGPSVCAGSTPAVGEIGSDNFLSVENFL